MSVVCFGLMDESFIVLSNSYVKRKKHVTPLASASEKSGNHPGLVTRVVRAILVYARLNGLLKWVPFEESFPSLRSLRGSADKDT